jgi:segregation and condensation protein A
MEYLVKTGEFEGPVHILLQLIQDRKMHVSEISLAAVTEDFLKFITSHTLSNAQVSSFIVVSSTLLLIKSRSLLPTLELTEEEEESITDLTERLRQYEVIRRYAEQLIPMWNTHPLFARNVPDRTPVFAPDPQIQISYLSVLLQDIFTAFPVLEKIPEKTMKVVVKLEEMIDDLRERIQKGMTLHSRDIMDRYRNAIDPTEKRQAKVFAVVSFLAMLELVKKGFASVIQDESFGDIELKTPHQEL